MEAHKKRLFFFLGITKQKDNFFAFDVRFKNEVIENILRWQFVFSKCRF